MNFIKSFPSFRQLGVMDCGPVCLKIIFSFYGADIPIDTLREKCQISKLGVSLLGISEAAELMGFRTISTKITINELKEISSFPCILHWNQNHFVVLYKLTSEYAYISDPVQGKIKLPLEEFLLSWTQKNETGGIVLFLEPTKEFTTASEGNPIRKASDWSYLFFHLKKYRKYFLQLIISLLFGSLVLLISPFLIEALVDKGIGEKNLSFVYLILLGQLSLFLGNTFVEIFRNWILLKIGARVTMNLVADFFLKLFQLPLSFFDTHLLGDLILRTNDHKRLETLLTTKSLNAIFAVFNLVLFGAVLFNYNVSVFFLFFSGSSLGICWIFLFMKRRAALDYKFFDLYGQQQGKMIELLSGVEEIKISNGSRQKRWEWEEVQAKIFKVRVKSLNLDQLQHNGFETIIRFTGIILTVITAKLVIEGEITLGTMFAINMIVGQLTNPIYSLVDFIPAWQDAKLALQRIGDVYNQKNEEENQKIAIMKFLNPPTLNSRMFHFPTVDLFRI
ncbi:MAG: hypothetical protein IPP32_01785 [Bacteroidetes bacterium]|nr:hypothetical protein [Bacteroidota bacterium]